MCAHLSAPHAPVYLAAVNTAVKGNAKQAADMWRSREGQQYFVARGCFHVPEDLSRGLLGLILKKPPACPTRWLANCNHSRV